MRDEIPQIGAGRPLSHGELVAWLREEEEARLESLWAAADEARRRNVGDEVHRRGLIEISNHCVRRCAYCGIRSANTEVVRYRMEPDEIVACARQAKAFGYGTVVLQSGEDLAHTTDFVEELVRRVAGETGLAITLSLGERPLEDYRRWRAAGADRYLLRFETTDPALFARIHPGYPGREPRLAILRLLRELDYEVGSGVMIGIPGQTFASLAADLELFRELDLDMIGVGPYIPHPATPLGRDGHPDYPPAPEGEQVPNSEAMTYKVVALTRLVRPDANIPSTTALATLNTLQGRELGLQRGANIVMPNLTPPKYRVLYEIYPGKACISETASQCALCLDGRIHAIGRVPGTGPGWRPGHEPRQPGPSGD
jgi:biotin synthase